MNRPTASIRKPSAPIRAAIFDFDGVLLDSLLPHLELCADKSRDYGLGLRIPTADAFKQRVRSGRRISPMYHFFREVGFPDALARSATDDYQTSFHHDYAPALFPGAAELLAELERAGLRLSIVSSNVRPNIVSALGPAIERFERDAILGNEDMPSGGKAGALTAIAERFAVSPAHCAYVGDQFADRDAAREAGMRFIGVSYGWAISEDDEGFPIAHRVSEIGDILLRR